MPKYYDFMICGYYLYFTSHCIVEAMHVHASDRHLTESGVSFLLNISGKRGYTLFYLYTITPARMTWNIYFHLIPCWKQ